jgi:hypothetical protein
VSNEVFKCARCGRAIGINDPDLSSWEAFDDESWSCEDCLTNEERGAIEANALDTFVQASVCIRCSRSRADLETGEPVGTSDPRFSDPEEWVVTDQGVICLNCKTHEDAMVEYSATIAGLDQLGALRAEREGPFYRMTTADLDNWRQQHPEYKGGLPFVKADYEHQARLFKARGMSCEEWLGAISMEQTTPEAMAFFLEMLGQGRWPNTVASPRSSTALRARATTCAPPAAGRALTAGASCGAVSTGRPVGQLGGFYERSA